MFVGIVIGTICLVGLVRAVTRRKWYGHGHHFAGGHGYGYGACGPRGFGPPGYGFRRGGRGMMWSLLARLDATPSQEKAILVAVDELKETAWTLRSTVRDTRGDLARTVRGESFDASALSDAGTRIDEASSKLRTAVSDALGKVHAVLDDRQRKILGDLIDSEGLAGC